MKKKTFNIGNLFYLIYPCYLLGVFGYISNPSWTETWRVIAVISLWFGLAILTVTAIVGLVFLKLSKGPYQRKFKEIELPTKKDLTIKTYISKTVDVAFLALLFHSPAKEHFHQFANLIIATLILSLMNRIIYLKLADRIKGQIQK